MYISELRNGEIVKTQVCTLPRFTEYDVILAGLGTAGSFAALFAAQNGLKVLGIESFNCVGGTMTIGGVQGHYFGCPGGRYVEIDNEVTAYHDAHTRSRIESCKIVLEKKILESGAEVLYESSIIGIYKEENTVIGVRAITPDGIRDFKCKVLMDCTGDAYIAHMAGCKTVYGRELDGLTQTYSMVSSLRVGTEVQTNNCDFGRVDQRDEKSLSEALIFSRAHELSDRKPNVKFMIHMPLLGVREGRIILSEENVTLEDVFADKFTKEPAFYSYADLDVHGWDSVFNGSTYSDWDYGANLGAYNVTVPVPYKSIIPLDIDGIIVPCRALGVDRIVAGCVRMVPSMKKLGETGADMALLAIRNNCKLRDIPYEELRDRLLASGCLDHAYNRGCRVDGWIDCDGNPLVQRNVTFIDNPADLEARLSTITPGEAIWSARRMGTKATATLKKLLSSNDENTRKHAAFALAITGDDSGIEILRDMARERDRVMLKDCRKHNRQRGFMAIYLLGRLQDMEIVDTLVDIITNKDELKRPAYIPLFPPGARYTKIGFNIQYFQFVINSVQALIRIGDAHPGLREKIASAFRTAFDDDSYIERITTLPKMSAEGLIAINIKTVAYAAAKRWG